MNDLNDQKRWLTWLFGYFNNSLSSDPFPDGINGIPELASLRQTKDTIEKIKDLCRVSSISVGVVHDGKEIYTASSGFCDSNDKNKLSNELSLYTLCSVSKTFVTIIFGILVEEGKINWTDTPSQHLPEFRPADNHQLPEEATFNDILRHSGGLENPVVTLLGPGGKVLVSKEDFIHVLNETPTQRNGEPLFGSWVYSNVAYGLVVLVIERVSGVLFSELLQTRILDPLGMKHTAVTKSQLANSDNIAQSHAQMSDGTWEKLDHDWTDEENSPVLGMVGIRSSVHDMMIYISAIMEAYIAHTSKQHDGQDPETPFPILSDIKENPIKQIGAILDDYYWTRLPDGDGDMDARYHLGWLKVWMPNSMVPWGSWNGTLADNAPESEWNYRNDNILGRDSGERLLVKSTGIGFCGTCSINWFPETRSGVVVFSSGANCADAADFTASLLIQALFNLQPKIDIIRMVHHEIEFKKRAFASLMQDIENHRDNSTAERPRDEYVGEYHGLGINLTIRQPNNTGTLQVCFNNRESVAQNLEHYGTDQYSYWPKSHDDWLQGGWLDWDYYLVGILSFQRDDEDKVRGVTWVWEEGAEPYLFKKVA